MQQSCRGLLSRAQVGAFTAHQSAFLLGPGRRIRGSVNWNSNVVVNALDFDLGLGLGLDLDLTSVATRGEACHGILGRLRLPTNPVPLPPLRREPQMADRV